MANRSVFVAPDYQIDEFKILYDLPPEKVQDSQTLQILMAKSNKTSDEITQMNNLLVELADYLITPEVWNKTNDCITNMENKIKNELDTVNSATTSGVTTINTSKDNALLSIEDKKNNIIEYMDNTTAGAIRNDIGIMTESTVEGTSLIDKTNNLATQELESTGYGVISGLTVTAQATPNMTVNIATGIVHMPTGVRLAPLGNSALAITTADVTNPRIDIIYVNSDSTIGYLAGTPSTTPVAPSTPENTFLLDEIYVDANVTSIVSGNITDKRKMKVTTEYLDNTINEHKADFTPHLVPCVRVYNNANQTLSNNVNTVLSFNSESFDTDSMHDILTNDTRLTCKHAGKYLISGNASMATNTTGVRQLILKLNGTKTIGSVIHSPTSLGSVGLQISAIYDLQVNDYVELYALQSSGGNLDVLYLNDFTPVFSMVKLG